MGQQIITVMALVLLTIAIVGANRLIVESINTRMEGEALHLAAGIAQSLLDEAKSKKFDHKAVETYYQATSEFTAATSLGPDGTEPGFSTISPDVFPFRSIGNYNDFDDYRNYVRVVNTGTIQGFIVKATVTYVATGNPESATTTRTYWKRMNVTVEHPTYLKKPIQLSTIKVY